MADKRCLCSFIALMLPRQMGIHLYNKITELERCPCAISTICVHKGMMVVLEHVTPSIHHTWLIHVTIWWISSLCCHLNPFKHLYLCLLLEDLYACRLNTLFALYLDLCGKLSITKNKMRKEWLENKLKNSDTYCRYFLSTIGRHSRRRFNNE